MLKCVYILRGGVNAVNAASLQIHALLISIYFKSILIDH